MFGLFVVVVVWVCVVLPLVMMKYGTRSPDAERPVLSNTGDMSTDEACILARKLAEEICRRSYERAD